MGPIVAEIAAEIALAMRPPSLDEDTDVDRKSKTLYPWKNLLDRQMRKTRLCHFYLNGTCKYGSKCTFAHERQELQSAPDLRKTRICKAFQNGNCTDEMCNFAHGQEDLRATDFCYKTTLCVWHAKGKCVNGPRCRFAHGRQELRGSAGPDEQPTGTSPTGSGSSAQSLQAMAQVLPPAVGPMNVQPAPVVADWRYGDVCGAVLGVQTPLKSQPLPLPSRFPQGLASPFAYSGEVPRGNIEAAPVTGSADWLYGALGAAGAPPKMQRPLPSRFPQRQTTQLAPDSLRPTAVDMEALGSLQAAAQRMAAGAAQRMGAADALRGIGADILDSCKSFPQNQDYQTLARSLAGIALQLQSLEHRMLSMSLASVGKVSQEEVLRPPPGLEAQRLGALTPRRQPCLVG